MKVISLYFVTSEIELHIVEWSPGMNLTNLVSAPALENNHLVKK